MHRANMKILRSFAQAICNRKIDCHVMADAIPPLLPRTKNILLDERGRIPKL